jgi:hypothetical protein
MSTHCVTCATVLDVAARIILVIPFHLILSLVTGHK